MKAKLFPPMICSKVGLSFIFVYIIFLFFSQQTYATEKDMNFPIIELSQKDPQEAKGKLLELVERDDMRINESLIYHVFSREPYIQDEEFLRPILSKWSEIPNAILHLQILHYILSQEPWRQRSRKQNAFLWEKFWLKWYESYRLDLSIASWGAFHRIYRDLHYPKNKASLCKELENVNVLKDDEELFSLTSDLKTPWPEKRMRLSYGVEFDHYLGVKAYGNQHGGPYQCTELVHRFFREQYGLNTRIGLGMGHGKDLSLNLMKRGNDYVAKAPSGPNKNKRLRFVFFENYCSPHLPTPGSSVSLDYGDPYGHIFIVRGVEQVSETVARLHIFHQHGMGLVHSYNRYFLFKNHLGYWGAHFIRGWTSPVLRKE